MQWTDIPDPSNVTRIYGVMHNGFYEGVMGILTTVKEINHKKYKLLPYLQFLLSNDNDNPLKNQNREILVTGHSLGGALATAFTHIIGYYDLKLNYLYT